MPIVVILNILVFQKRKYGKLVIVNFDFPDSESHVRSNESAYFVAC